MHWCRSVRGCLTRLGDGTSRQIWPGQGQGHSGLVPPLPWSARLLELMGGPPGPAHATVEHRQLLRHRVVNGVITSVEARRIVCTAESRIGISNPVSGAALAALFYGERNAGCVRLFVCRALLKC
jgi:hypothetical protein